MKKITTLLFVSIFFMSSFAQYRNDNEDDDRNRNNDEQYNRNRNGNNGGIYNSQSSALVVSSFSQNRFVVNIDNNIDYPSNDNNGNGNTVNIGTMQAGNHTVTIYEVKRGIFGNQKQQQIYSSVLYFKPDTETSININYNGQVSVNEKPLFNNGGYGSNGSSCGPGNNGNGRGYGYGRKKDKRNKHGKHARYDDDDDRGYPSNYPTGYPNQYPGNNRQISDYDFGTLKQYVRKEAFDDRRINIAKQAAGNSYFSTSQVKELMGIFSFDEGKLDVAKYLYNRTADRNNYYQLTDALSFGSSKDALLAFIRR